MCVPHLSEWELCDSENLSLSTCTIPLFLVLWFELRSHACSLSYVCSTMSLLTDIASHGMVYINLRQQVTGHPWLGRREGFNVLSKFLFILRHCLGNGATHIQDGYSHHT